MDLELTPEMPNGLGGDDDDEEEDEDDDRDGLNDSYDLAGILGRGSRAGQSVSPRQ